MTTGIDLIKGRRAAIQRERAQHLEAMADLEAEDKELDNAERVLARLQNATERERPTVRVRVRLPRSIPSKGTPRPKDIPTTRAMIDEVLADAEAHGKRGLVGKDLLLGIEKRWWPGVGWTSVLPEANRLIKKSGILRKEGKLFVRVKKNEAPSVPAEGASKVTGEVDASPNERKGGTLF